MKKINSANLKKVAYQVKKAKKIIWFLGEHTFLTILLSILLGLFLAGIVFYKHSFLAQKEQPQVSKTTIRFKERTYQEVLNYWQQKKERFKEIKEREYQNPFLLGEEEEEESTEPLTYTVIRGDNLWNLAEKYLGTGFRWKEITDIEGNTFSTYTARVLQPSQNLIIPPE